MQKKKQSKRKTLLFCAFCVAFLCGCQGNTDTQPEMIPEATVQSDYEVEMEQREGFVGEEKYEQNFTRPQVLSNIFVDLMGYAPEDKKYAYFVGENLSETFYVMDSASDKRVFTGTLKKMKNQSSDGKSVYKGDFSQITEPGVYYIQTAIIGQSYTFRIDKNRYLAQYDELKKEFLTLAPEKYYGEAENSRDRMQIYYTFQKLATAYQLYPESFGEEYEKKLEEHAQWLIDMRQQVLAERDTQLRESGLRYNYTQPGDAEQQVVKEDYVFASSMAAGYCVLQPYNAPLAGQSLSQAQRAYQNAARFKLTGDLQYMAAASLFRAVGNYTYHAVIKETYKQDAVVVKEGYTVLTREKTLLCDAKLWGNLFYMTSVKGADLTICDKQMSEMMDLCGGYLNSSPQRAFGRIAGKADSLEKAIWLAIADYTIVSREYRNVCKEQIHAMLYSMQEINLSHKQKATLLLILGNLAESEDAE